ncbi:MAG TPA: RDD family protein [Pyrinomonadaceae bacterium]|nr:RDD family protein [Pyrinomonadaceae bacterium]
MKATSDSPTSPPERRSTLIEFPGISRNSMPEWRKELSERVREVQERRAREAAHEAAEAERQRAETTSNPPQLELLTPTEAPAMNPLVAAALKRIERAHQSASVETRVPRTSLATAVAYAPEREENIMNETVPPTIQLEFETEPPVEETPPPVEKTHLMVVPPPIEPVVIKTEIPQLPKRLIRDDPNDPALNYLDAICRNVRVDDLASQSASAFRRVVSAVFDLIISALLTSPIAGALYLTGNLNFHDTRVLTVLGGSLVVVTFLYLTLTTALTGRTLGMRMLSLRVIDTKTGLIPTGGQSIGRSFFYLLSLATVVGILFALVSREGYTAHDRFTRTAVVIT